MRIIGRRTTDYFYVPIHLVENYIDVAAVFFKHNVFVEIAGTAILSCIDDDNSQKQPFGSLGLWGDSRSHLDKHFQIFLNQSDMHAFHPAKWSPLLDGNHKEHNDTLSFYCNTVIPWLHSD